MNNLKYKRENFIQIPQTVARYTVQKMKFSITDFFSKCDQIRRKLRIFCAVIQMEFASRVSGSSNTNISTRGHSKKGTFDNFQ